MINKQNLDYIVSKMVERDNLYYYIRLYNNPFKPMKNSF